MSSTVRAIHRPDVFVATIREKVKELERRRDIHDVQWEQQNQYLNHSPDQSRACSYTKLLRRKPSSTPHSCNQVIKTRATEGNRRLHFACAVHSHHCLPADRRLGQSSTCRRRTEPRT